MKAIVCHEYGPPELLALEEVEKPSPKDQEVLVKIEAASVNAGDWHLMRADPFLIRLVFGLRRPNIKILGADIAGRVEAVGAGVTRFQAGDEVFGDLSGCGFGAFAEYVCANADVLATKPSNVSFEQAAATPAAAVTALQALREKGNIQPGQKVLINGASGGVGAFAVQIAKSFDTEVTAVCSTRNLELASSLGADHVIDYTKEDFTKSDQRYDLIVAANGYHPISAYRRALTDRGVYVMVGGALAQMFQAMLLGPWISLVSKKKMGSFLVAPNSKDLEFVKELIEAGKLTFQIDRRYPLSQVPDAIKYMEDEHAQGKVIISMEEGAEAEGVP